MLPQRVVIHMEPGLCTQLHRPLQGPRHPVDASYTASSPTAATVATVATVAAVAAVAASPPTAATVAAIATDATLGSDMHVPTGLPFLL
jgi:hypothetical protein